MADCLVKFGLSLDRQLQIFEIVPQFLSTVVLVDVSSPTFPRGF